MTYQQAIDYLYTQLPMFQRIGASAFKKDLTNTLKLCEYFGQPQNNYPSIHIAGTNGKGSVSHMLASALQESGYKVGLYTSPHLKSFTERIKINGKEVTADFVTDFVERNQDFFSSFDPSFFEITVAMAFEYFAKENVDIAVIETGMGGRLDSTNVITPLLSVITNIGMDHMQFLGNTIAEIAGEKAGIIKPAVPVVIGESYPESDDVFRKRSGEENSPVFFADEVWQLEGFEYAHEEKQLLHVHLLNAEDGRLQEIYTDLVGSYQLKNVITVSAARDVINRATDFRISDAHFLAGLRNVTGNTGLKGRWQTLGTSPLIIADTGHNKPGLTCVLAQLQTYTYTTLRMVIGFVNDKDVDEVLKLFPREAVYYFTRADIPRAMDEKILAEKAHTNGLTGQPYPTVAEALQAAKNDAAGSDLIFVGGSTFVVAEVV